MISRREIRSHGGCGFEPCETATNMVPGEGDPDADVMLVGEAPGRDRGRAGPAVRRAAPASCSTSCWPRPGSSASRSTSPTCVKARPPGNRDPKRRRGRAPHAVAGGRAGADPAAARVPLGRHALAHFTDDVKISEVHGTEMNERGRALFPLYHPAAALRGQAMRETLFEDARELKEALAREAVARRARSCPSPGGLVDVSVPSAAPTRSARPLSPEPGLACAPPMPSSRTSTTRSPFSRVDAHGGVRRLGVLGDVGQRLGDREVGGRLDRRRAAGPSGSVDDLDRQRRAGDERRDRRREPALGQHRGVDAARQLAQLGRGLRQLLADALEERAGAAPGPCRPARRAIRTSSASATSRCCAPSCRSRSILRRAASAASTMRAREACSSSVRAALDLARAAAPPRRRGAR